MQAHHSFWLGEPVERNTKGAYRPILFHICRGTRHRDRNWLAIHSHSSRHSLFDHISEQSLLTVHGPYFYNAPELQHFPFIHVSNSFPFNLYDEEIVFFLVFATIGATNPVDDFDVWDFQRRQNTLGIANGSHSISGAAFTPEPPVVLVKAVKTLWTDIPFPQIPQLDPKPLNQILNQALFELMELDLRTFQHECADTHLFSYWKQRLRDNLAEEFQSH